MRIRDQGKQLLAPASRSVSTSDALKSTSLRRSTCSARAAQKLRDRLICSARRAEVRGQDSRIMDANQELEYMCPESTVVDHSRASPPATRASAKRPCLSGWLVLYKKLFQRMSGQVPVPPPPQWQRLHLFDMSVKLTDGGLSPREREVG